MPICNNDKLPSVGMPAEAFMLLFAGVFCFLYGGLLLEEMMDAAGTRLSVVFARLDGEGGAL